MDKNNESKVIFKKVILLIRERIFFNKVKDIKQNVYRNSIIISNNNDYKTTKDMAAYHEYYLKYKKIA